MEIIYLDTSFLSQFSKLVQGNLRAATDNQIWEELLTRLRQGVQKGALLCPASQFQTQEALLAPSLFSEFTNLQLELSKGLFFKDWQNILVHQCANQLLIYLNRAKEIELDWKCFTEEVPPIIIPKATVKSKLKISLFAKEKQEEGTLGRSFDEQYMAEKANLLRETFLQPYCYLKGAPTLSNHSGTFEEIYKDSFLAKVIDEAKIPLDKTTETVNAFGTDLVDRIPFIRIFCSLWASIRIYEGTRNPKEGDWLDIAMACVIPYCSLVTTDGDMKNRIIDRLNYFDKNHVMEIYTPSPKELPAFIGRLSQCCGQRT